jgi:hypothetical protein
VAAALAATAAVGVGARVARAELERRGQRRRLRKQRRFGLLPNERPGEGLKRVALGQLDLAIDQLVGGPPDSAAVHETRKALKRLRALVRLLEGSLGTGVLSVERETLRDVGRRLAAARDAEVLLGSFEDLLERGPRKLARRRGVEQLRQRLEQERDSAQARLAGDAVTRMQVLGELHAMRARVPGWPLPDDAGLEQLEAGVQRIYRQGRRRHRHAAKARGADRGRALHEWRKRVKDLRYVAEMLERGQPRGGRERRRARARRKQLERAQRRLHRIATRADDLGEVLGSEHDLAVLAERIDSAAELRRGSARRLRMLIRRRRRELRRQALREGERLYGRKPRRFVRRVRGAYAPPRSVDADHGQLALAPWQRNGHLLAGRAPQQGRGEWGIGGQAPFPRSGIVRADDAPALLRSLLVPHDHG